MADGGRPSAASLDVALAEATAAAQDDDRWAPLEALVRRARAAAGTPASAEAVDALVAECQGATDFVRRGGREPPRA